MDTPQKAGSKPAVHDLEPGSYACCACGLSQDQPWCDGSHKGTGFSPKMLTVETRKTYALCMCKHSAAMPLCDGTHSKLPKEE